jgi:hypothetical protein
LNSIYNFNIFKLREKKGVTNMLKKHQLIMNKIEDETAGGGAAADEVSNGETSQTDEAAVDWKAKALEYEKSVKALEAKRDELLGDLVKKKQALKEYEESKKNATFKNAEEKGDHIEMVKLLKSELEEARNAIKEREEAENESKEKLLREAKIAAFMKELGGELYNPKDVERADLSLVVLDEQTKTFNNHGLKKAVEKFRTEYGYAVKPSNSLPQSAPKGANTQGSKELSSKEKLKALGLNL